MIIIREENARLACRSFTLAMLVLINQHRDEFFHLAISGGETAKRLLRCWKDEFCFTIPWNRIKLFWVDERAVDPSSSESNYHEAFEEFLFLDWIPKDQIFRMEAEGDLAQACAQYDATIRKHLPDTHDNVPIFDLICLGVGDDGHTASLFPDQYFHFFNPDECVAQAEKWQTQQKRMTLTYPIINRARSIFFLVLGEEKAQMLTHFINNQEEELFYPASYVQTYTGDPILFTDVNVSGVCFPTK